MQQEKLNIVEIDISTLKYCEYNPRKIDDIGMEQIKESISKFNLIQPILVN